MQKNKTRAKQIIALLKKEIQNPQSALNWKDPWELLVSTVLAAQCTDKRVNQVTPMFFSLWPDSKALAQADPVEVENIIRSTGFFRNKAKNLIQSAQKIEQEFQGQVPQDMQELISLPGVARKTANIILSNAFNINQGIAVDTHVRRISNRLGFTNSKNPARIEKDLIELFAKDEWGELNHLLVIFGRKTCKARNPDCSACILAELCPRIGV